MKKINLKNVVWKEGKYYVSWNINTDVSSFGNTKKEALINLQDALELYFEDEKIEKVEKIERPSLATLTLKHA